MEFLVILEPSSTIGMMYASANTLKFGDREAPFISVPHVEFQQYFLACSSGKETAESAQRKTLLIPLSAVVAVVQNHGGSSLPFGFQPRA